MKKILCIFCVILLLVLSIVPSFAYSASFESIDNDSDLESVSACFESANMYFKYKQSTSTSLGCTFTFDDTGFVINGTVSSSSYFNVYEVFSFIAPVDSAFYFECLDSSFNSATYLALSVRYPNVTSSTSLSQGTVVPAGSTVFINIYKSVEIGTIFDNEKFFIYFSDLPFDSYSFGTYNLGLSDYISTFSPLYSSLRYFYLYQNSHSNYGCFVKAYSDSVFSTDITSSVASSSGLELTNDSIYLEFDENGFTPKLYYDGTVYYVLTLHPSGGYVYTNLYRHIILEYGSGFVHFFDNCKPLFIIIVGSTATVAFVYVIYLFIKKHKE